jgi:uncharacterized protein YuzE
MIVAIRCVDGNTAEIGDRVWTSATEHGEIIGIGRDCASALLRMAGDLVLQVFPSTRLRKEQPPLYVHA